MELRDKVAVITGASSGIGEATALAFAKRGVAVVLAARRVERLEALAERIERTGGRALAVPVDVTDRDRLVALPSVVTEAFGPPDILVNNAGIPGGGEFAELSYEQIERLVRTNVLGAMYATRAFLPGMLERGRGHVVNVASIAGRFAPPGSSVYTATKHAIVAFSEGLNYETEPRRVLVTAVNPALVRTEGFPMKGVPSFLLLKVDTVAEAIVGVVRDRIAPERSVPRFLAPFQLFRVLTPPLYRWGIRQLRRTGHRSTPAR